MNKTANSVKSIFGVILILGGIYVIAGYLVLGIGYFHPYRKDNIAEIVRFLFFPLISLGLSAGMTLAICVVMLILGFIICLCWRSGAGEHRVSGGKK